MNVATLPCLRAMFLTMYLYQSTLSAMLTSESNFMSISHWPAVATSWWCTSTGMPTCSIVRIISLRMSCSESCGGTGK